MCRIYSISKGIGGDIVISEVAGYRNSHCQDYYPEGLDTVTSFEYKEDEQEVEEEPQDAVH